MHGFKPTTERDGINLTIYDWFNLNVLVISAETSNSLA